MQREKYLDPLSDDEIVYYFTRLRNGDTEAANIIAEHNLKLVDYVVNLCYDYNIIEKDDLYSVGRLGLVKAINSYDLTKKVKFSTYVVKCVKVELFNFYRKESVPTISLENLYFESEDGERKICSILKSSDKELIEDFIRKDFVQYLLNTLNSKERKIIEMYFGLGEYETPQSQRNIAEKYGVTKQYISKIINDTLKDLKHCIESENYANIKRLKINS